jgi:hypothetical protein
MIDLVGFFPDPVFVLVSPRNRHHATLSLHKQNTSSASERITLQPLFSRIHAASLEYVNQQLHRLEAVAILLIQ